MQWSRGLAKRVVLRQGAARVMARTDESPSSVASALPIRTQCFFHSHTLSHIWTSSMSSRPLLFSSASSSSSLSPSSIPPLISAIQNSSLPGRPQAHLMSMPAQVFFRRDPYLGYLPGMPSGKPRFVTRTGISAWAKTSRRRLSKNVHSATSGGRTSRRFVFYFRFFFLSI